MIRFTAALACTVSLLVTSPLAPVIDIDWGGVDPSLGMPSEFSSGISYGCVSVSGTTNSPGFLVSCGSSDRNKSRAKEALDNGLPAFSCLDLYQKGSALNDAEQYDAAYDTLRYFIETCHDFKGSWQGFNRLNSTVQYLSKDTARWLAYREWLKSVLYLNTTDPNYFCYDVLSITSTFQFNGKERGNDRNSGAAILLYLLESGKCPQLDAHIRNNYSTGRRYQYELWRDTVTVDTNLYPFDTTVPSLESLGLEILRGQPSTVTAPSRRSGDQVLGSLTSSNNPVGKEAVLNINLTDDATITLDVFDELGRVVYSSGGFFKSGSVTLTVPGEVLPSGLLYARIMTSQGEVKTVKLLKR